jgi:hypothetical protein
MAAINENLEPGPLSACQSTTFRIFMPTVDLYCDVYLSNIPIRTLCALALCGTQFSLYIYSNWKCNVRRQINKRIVEVEFAVIFVQPLFFFQRLQLKVNNSRVFCLNECRHIINDLVRTMLYSLRNLMHLRTIAPHVNWQSIVSTKNDLRSSIKSWLYVSVNLLVFVTARAKVNYFDSTSPCLHVRNNDTCELVHTVYEWNIGSNHHLLLVAVQRAQSSRRMLYYPIDLRIRPTLKWTVHTSPEACKEFMYRPIGKCPLCKPRYQCSTYLRVIWAQAQQRRFKSTAQLTAETSHHARYYIAV